MAIFQHHVLVTAPHGAGAVARHALGADAAARAAGGRVFGVFTPQIGLSTNHVVMISEFPGEAAARGVDLLAGAAAGVERHEFWEAAPRPAAGETIAETDGVFSHRWFDCAEADWPRFQALSIAAWDSFEDVNDTRVIGFWRSRTPPADGVARVWLMAWYRDLGVWQGSRWYNDATDPAAAAYRARFAERRTLTLDTAVSILTRVV
jgi:hypothetical protein